MRSVCLAAARQKRRLEPAVLRTSFSPRWGRRCFAPTGARLFWHGPKGPKNPSKNPWFLGISFSPLECAFLLPARGCREDCRTRPGRYALLRQDTLHFLCPWGAPAAVGVGRTASVQNDRTPHTARREPTAERNSRTPILIQAPQEPLAQRRGWVQDDSPFSAAPRLLCAERQVHFAMPRGLRPVPMGFLGACPLSGVLATFSPRKKWLAAGAANPPTAGTAKKGPRWGAK